MDQFNLQQKHPDGAEDKKNQHVSSSLGTRHVLSKEVSSLFADTIFSPRPSGKKKTSAINIHIRQLFSCFALFHADNQI